MHFKDLTNSPKAKTFKNDTRGSFIKNKIYKRFANTQDFFKGPFGLRGKGGRVEESRVELIENRLILS